VDVVWHDDECVEGETALIAIAEEGLNHQFGVCSSLKDAVGLMGRCVQFLTNRSYVKEGILQGLKALPLLVWWEAQG